MFEFVRALGQFREQRGEKNFPLFSPRPLLNFSMRATEGAPLSPNSVQTFRNGNALGGLFSEMLRIHLDPQQRIYSENIGGGYCIALGCSLV